MKNRIIIVTTIAGAVTSMAMGHHGIDQRSDTPFFVLNATTYPPHFLPEIATKPIKDTLQHTWAKLYNCSMALYYTTRVVCVVCLLYNVLYTRNTTSIISLQFHEYYVALEILRRLFYVIRVKL